MRSMDIVRAAGEDIVPDKAKPAHKAEVGKQKLYPSVKTHTARSCEKRKVKTAAPRL